MNSIRSPLDGRVAEAFPILQTIEWAPPREIDGYWINALGARARKSYIPNGWIDAWSCIAVNEMMFEWVAIAESIFAASDHYVMVNLGAGYGEWIVNSALLARRYGRTFFGIGVEAEDTHFSWMEQHLADNQIPVSARRLFHTPITGLRREVAFTVGHAAEWYGQAVLPNPEGGFGDWPLARVEMRRSVVLEDIVGDLPLIDLVDVDIQGMEAEVLSSSIQLMDQRVKRLHVGTHSREIEEMLRTLMSRAGWRPRFDYPCASLNYPTPAGPVDFTDGVQEWVNPRLA